MKKYIAILAVALMLLYFTLNILSKPPEINSGIVIHINGKYRIISPEDRGYGKLKEECLEILKAINGQYKLGIKMDGLNSIKAHEDYVEIVFPEIITLKTNYRNIHLKGAVFVLSGKYRNTIFTYRNVIVGVWSSSRSFEKLMKIAGEYT